MPQSFDEHGNTENATVLVLILGLSVLFSVAAGYLLARIAGRFTMRFALALGMVQLVVGTLVQIQFWQLMPIWYHLSFLALLAPGILAGAKVATDRQGTRLSPA